MNIQADVSRNCLSVSSMSRPSPFGPLLLLRRGVAKDRHHDLLGGKAFDGVLDEALDGGDDGLDFYRRIISGAPAHLANYGMLFLEIGFDQAEDVSRILTEAGFRDISVIKDYSDNDRVISARNRV